MTRQGHRIVIALPEPVTPPIPTNVTATVTGCSEAPLSMALKAA